MITDAWPFLVQDAEAEKSFGFSLRESLDRVNSDGGMLSGYKVHVTKSVKPAPNVMKEVIKLAGGSVSNRIR